mmetsp:Transcript_26371/g.25244  ORF Transcript_26371/g.25244 Transcript_26371/m.25244 type:complete len:525 (+) Transcript_26371:279-1853(+)
MMSQVRASCPQASIASKKECCLFYKYLPTDSICHILQYYGEMTIKQLARFSSMTSGLQTAIFSKNLGLSLPPICLCNSTQCSMKSCDREKVPILFYKKILSEGCSLSKNADLHIYSDISTVGTLTESIFMLIEGCKATINDLVLHISIGIQSDNQTESVVDKTLTMSECGIGNKGSNSPDSITDLPENLERDKISNQGATTGVINSPVVDNASALLTICDNEISSSDILPYKKETMFPNLHKLLVTIEYSRMGDEFLTGSICISILNTFGFDLKQLSIIASSVKSRMCKNESYTEPWARDERKKLMRHQYDVNQCPFVALCPLLIKLELNGCSTDIFSNQITSDMKYSQADILNHTCTQCPKRKKSICLYSAALKNENKITFNFPNLSTVEVEEDFQSADEIFNIINCVSPSIKNIILMGNTISKYFNDILGFFNADKKGNFRCLEILEIHDSHPWPFSDNEINQLDTSVANVFIVCPLLKRIVMLSVQVSDDVYLYLLNKALIVTQDRLNYSTVISRKSTLFE